jgi:hypothetical protein
MPFDGMCDDELFYWPALSFNSVRGSKCAYLSLAIRQMGSTYQYADFSHAFFSKKP